MSTDGCRRTESSRRLPHHAGINARNCRRRRPTRTTTEPPDDTTRQAENQTERHPRTQPQPMGVRGRSPPGGAWGLHPHRNDETSPVHAFREQGSPTSGVARAGIEPATFRFSGGRSYQLSYLAAGTRSECHTRNAGYLRRLLATLTGLEPATSAVTGRRANQLRHRAMLCYQRSEDRTPYGIRTRATALKGRRPRPLDEGGSPRISPDRLSTAVRWELG
jgi:hypothetical protein